MTTAVDEAAPDVPPTRNRLVGASSASGFPTTADLANPFGRATVAVAAGLDVGLRTAAATIVAGAGLAPFLRPGAGRRAVEQLQFHADLARRRPNVDEVFVAPSGAPDVELVSREPVTWRWLPGTLDVLRFTSSFQTLHPELRDDYAGHAKNRVAWAQHWRHDDGVRPTVVVVHGFMASPAWFNRLFFSLPWLFSGGYDLLLVTLPFHGRRATTPMASGAEIFAHGPATFVETMLQAVHDLRSWVDHLFATGVEQVGMTGLSMGGYLTALMADVDERLTFAIPNAPVTDFGDLLDTWAPASTLARHALPRYGAEADTFATASRLHSPLHFPRRLDRDRLFVIAGLGDRLAPPEQAERLWEHWDRPAFHLFPGNHVLHVERGAYLRRMGRFIRSTGFCTSG